MRLLKDAGVAAFTYNSDGSTQIAFHGRDDLAFTDAESHTDDGHSTSTKRVDGFSSKPVDTYSFRNPKLWPGQNGKTLRLDGQLD